MGPNGGRQLHWYQGLSKYHWWVLAIGVLSWTFDCMDQRIFVLSRSPAMKELADKPEFQAIVRQKLETQVAKNVKQAVKAGTVASGETETEITKRVEEQLKDEYKKSLEKKAAAYGNIVTALMVVGWSIGGFFFGVYGDRLGRVKTLSLAIAVYSVFTGLSGLSVGLLDFCIYRLLMGCGIGGAFATAATLIAETMPTHARAAALGVFQALSAVGNIAGSFIARFVISPDLNTNLFGLLGAHTVSGWRILFMIGVIPAILVVLIMRSVKEPDAWLEARETAAGNLGRQLGDIKGLFATPRWRRNTIVGVSLAVVGVIGLWGIGFFSPELIEAALKEKHLTAEQLSNAKAMGTLLQDVGALLGMLAFTYIATHVGRRIAFGGAFIFCWIVVSGVFMFLSQSWQVYVFLPILGFATLSLFGGYSIYFPELYPARLRSTGTGFCYNVGRVLAAGVIVMKIPLGEMFKTSGTTNLQLLRIVSVVLASVYLLGLGILFWAPETKGKPLPTDDD